jgi:hypothetical protein
VELEQIVGAMRILGVLHNVATGEFSPESRIGEAELAGLIVIPHLDIDTAKAIVRPRCDLCEVHVRHLHSDKLEQENGGEKKRCHGQIDQSMERDDLPHWSGADNRGPQSR